MGLAASLIVGVAAGLVLGLVFFGGLLWTVRRIPRSSRPWLLAVTSFVVRAAVAAGALFLLVRAGSLPAVGAGLLGFLVARLALTRAVAARPSAGGGE